jgi:hypothetical protein
MAIAWHKEGAHALSLWTTVHTKQTDFGAEAKPLPGQQDTSYRHQAGFEECLGKGLKAGVGRTTPSSFSLPPLCQCGFLHQK